MSENLMILAGKSAHHHIRENGLKPDDIDAMLGASGAAKWLSICGLDNMIFSQWFKERARPLHLFGTSIGAWKFAAAAQKDCRQAFERLKHAYTRQRYNGKVTAAKVATETHRIMAEFLTPAAIDQILSHPFIRIGFSAVRCKSLLASEIKPVQAIGIWSAFELNVLSRSLQRFCFERILFHDPRYDTRVMTAHDFETTPVSLDRDNFAKALLASGSIPLVMEGVRKIPGAPKGTFRDGGLLDYHPVFSLGPDCSGFILYPHFYPEITWGWFDKKFSKRRATGQAVDRIILLAPSKEFVSSLPFGRIPDRQDFIRFKGQDDDRIAAWDKAADMCQSLADEFMEAVESGAIRDRVQKIGD